MLYFMIKDLPRLHKSYQFSLRWYLDHFEKELKNKSNINPNIDALVDLNNRLTQTTYNMVCMGMKQQDKVLVAFLLTLNMAGSEIKLPEDQLEFIIKGPGIKTEIPVEEMTQVEKDELDVRLRMSMNHPQF